MVRLVYAVIFGCILALGLPLNATSLWILLRHHGFSSPNAVLMVNLAVSDLLLVIFLPMRVYYYATGTWPLGKMACVLVTLLFRDNYRSSSIFITFISVDRLLAVVYPLRSRHLRTTSVAVKGAALVWLYVLVLNVPEGLDMSKRLFSQNETSCFESAYPKNPRTPILAYFHTVVMFIMLAVNIGCTAMVLWTLHHHVSKSPMINKVKIMVIFAMNLVIFIICFLPITLYSVMVISSSDLTFMICLATVNCCLDPLLYYFSLDAFWRKKEDGANVRRETRTNDTEFL